MTKEYALGIDVGTTGVKVLLVDEAGKVKADALIEHPMHTPKPLWAEQDPEDWWRGTKTGIKTVLSKGHIEPGQIASIGLTGQMHGLVLLDKTGKVLRPCIMWNDLRCALQCEEVTKEGGIKKILALTGNKILPGFTAPKIKWVRENEPDVYKRIAGFLLPKDYIRYRLTGELLSDVVDASGTSLFDVRNRKWSKGMLDIFDIPEHWLPHVTESIAVSSHTSKKAEAQTGLPKGILVIGGAGDQAAQAVGAGVINDGAASVTIGTSGVVFAATKNYASSPDGSLHAFCHAIPGMWHLMGVMLSAGGSFRWYRDTLCEGEKRDAKKRGIDAYDVMTRPIKNIPAGSDGLIFLPYISGERTPYSDPHARGVFFGLTLRHTKAHMTRAVMEGVTFGLRDSLELMRQLGLKVSEVRASGGGAKSLPWCQIIADIFKTEVLRLRTVEGAAFGAALLAGVGCGMFRDVAEACGKGVEVRSRLQPKKNAKKYGEYYKVYRSLYPALKRNFEAVSRLADAENPK